ncbi:MAG: isoprenylcysteine carboxyl methyltransferase [Chloroflexi bacterium B3_Chlor]|nr:MAG: isoprenylcysteine carboxyl methyltransferase [Chloroflexi bacterium B3_Chlor]
MEPGTAKPDLTRGILKRGLQIGIQMLVTAAILFISSGRLDWWMAWVYLGIQVVGVGVNSFVLMRISPELIAERAEVGAGTKGWDRILASLWGLMSLATLLIAGLDMRFGWSPEISPAVQVVALVLVVLGFSFSSWAMLSNAFFSGAVRIQEERGHTVCSSGPYRFVRHPGYAGWTLSGIALTLMLGSLWAVIPAVLAAIALVVRSAFEDKMLQEELDGYSDYAQRVRYRLVPGLW